MRLERECSVILMTEMPRMGRWEGNEKDKRMTSGLSFPGRNVRVAEESLKIMMFGP